MHAPWLPTFAVQDTWLPAKPPSDGVGAPCGSIIVRFPLARIGQPVTVPTGEDGAAEENRHAPPAPACRAAKPHPPPAKVAERPFQSDGVLHRLPLAAIASASPRHEALRACAKTNRRAHFRAVRSLKKPCPRLTGRMSVPSSVPFTPRPWFRLPRQPGKGTRFSLRRDRRGKTQIGSVAFRQVVIRHRLFDGVR